MFVRISYLCMHWSHSGCHLPQQVNYAISIIGDTRCAAAAHCRLHARLIYIYQNTHARSHLSSSPRRSWPVMGELLTGGNKLNHHLSCLRCYIARRCDAMRASQAKSSSERAMRATIIRIITMLWFMPYIRTFIHTGKLHATIYVRTEYEYEHVWAPEMNGTKFKTLDGALPHALRCTTID